jgi:SAM-dependent methyltransferase
MLSEEVDSSGPIAQDTVCIVCAGTSFVERWPGLLKCETCEFITADMRKYGDEDFEKLYGHDYFHGDEYHDYIAEKAITQKSFKLRMRKLDQFLDSTRHRSVLEIGSAYGFFLDFVKDRFAKVMGTDVAVEGVEYAQSQGLDVRLGDISRMDLDDSYDLVCLWDTIEHLAHPEEHLQIVSDRTQPGALIAVTTGDIGSPLARARGRKWRLIHPPTHLHYFSEKTLTKFLERYGFKVVHSSYCGGYRSLEFAANFILNIQWNKPRLYRAVQRTGLLKFAPYMNMGDIRYIIAERV